MGTNALVLMSVSVPALLRKRLAVIDAAVVPFVSAWK
jgi:hypothetical protein